VKNKMAKLVRWNSAFKNLAITMVLMSCVTANAWATHTSTHQFKKIMLVVAMDTEANPNIFALNFHKSTHSFAPLPMQAYA